MRWFGVSLLRTSALIVSPAAGSAAAAAGGGGGASMPASAHDTWLGAWPYGRWHAGKAGSTGGVRRAVCSGGFGCLR
jgi:hypothetical protein